MIDFIHGSRKEYQEKVLHPHLQQKRVFMQK